MNTLSKGHYAIITEEKSVRGWTVSVSMSGQKLCYAVFRTLEQAQAYADFERRRFGLPRSTGQTASHVGMGPRLDMGGVE